MSNVYLDQPCDRCGSKRKTARTWKEKLPTLSGGTTEIEYSQIVCRNNVCQAKFEKKLLSETRKNRAIKRKKEANDALRKAAKKTKSRI